MGNKSNTNLPLIEANNPSKPGATATLDADSQAKKRRTEITPTSSQLPSFATLKAANTMKHKKSASVAVAPASTDTPKYAPWDRVAFLQRLKSFSNLTDWTPKPARVNEVEWAKRGWVCQKSERVRCCLCNVEIVVKLNKKEVEGKEVPVYVPGNIGTKNESSLEKAADSATEDALVDKYVELIVESHNEDCLWRQRGCDGQSIIANTSVSPFLMYKPDSIFKLPLTHIQNTSQALRERYHELVTRKDNLPYIFNLRTPETFDLETILRYLPSDFLASSQDTALRSTVNRVAFLMALFGWQGHTAGRLGPQLGSVSCHACFRVLGLWLFKSKSVNEAGEEVKGPVVNGLDACLEHRDYCPWRNAASQNGLNPTVKSSTNKMPGWEIVVRVLKNEHQLRSSKATPPPRTPVQPDNHGASESPQVADDADAQSIRDEEDKKRWARLRRVKSLFETKGGKKIPRTDTAGKQGT